MNNLDTLKQELLSQKTAIENKGGTVVVAENNPSPSEITAGINTIIQGVDMTDATATPADVESGKTYYAGNLTKKTGTRQSMTKDMYDIMFFYTANQNDTQSRVTFTCPSYYNKIVSYKFHNNANNVDFVFSPSLTEIGGYAFSGCTNFRFPNFSGLTSLTKIGTRAFAYTNGIDFSALPVNLTYIDMSAFREATNASSNIVLPQGLTYLGSHSFYEPTKTNYNSLQITNTQLEYCDASVFENCIFNCDFTPPATAQLIASKFNCGGSFNHITIPSTCVHLMDKCFGTLDNTDSLQYYKLKTITFESTTPPYIDSTSIAPQHLTNGCKIYVPDAAVQVYKYDIKFSYYADYIYPVSERP